jgi:hypothetical protein
MNISVSRHRECSRAVLLDGQLMVELSERSQAQICMLGSDFLLDLST